MFGKTMINIFGWTIRSLRDVPGVSNPGKPAPNYAWTVGKR